MAKRLKRLRKNTKLEIFKYIGSLKNMKKKDYKDQNYKLVRKQAEVKVKKTKSQKIRLKNLF